MAADKEYRFDTGLLRGTLRAQGKSMGLLPVVESASGAALAKSFGWLSPYRLLDAEARYGTAAWDWPSTARLRDDGSVEVAWPPDAEHPFAMQAVYRWARADTLDLTLGLTAKKERRQFEVFLASYFEGFPRAWVYAQSPPETQGQPQFVEAVKPGGAWQMFCRDARGERRTADGRWKRPPHPVDWTLMPRLAAPLALRRDATRELCAVLMAPPAECFAIAMPYGEESHRSVYLSLLGADLKPGQAASARARLIVRRHVTDEQAVALYREFLKEVER